MAPIVLGHARGGPKGPPTGTSRGPLIVALASIIESITLEHRTNTGIGEVLYWRSLVLAEPWAKEVTTRQLVEVARRPEVVEASSVGDHH